MKCVILIFASSFLDVCREKLDGQSSPSFLQAKFLARRERERESLAMIDGLTIADGELWAVGLIWADTRGAMDGS